MRASTSITVKDKKRLVLEDFRGVDFSSSPMNVNPKRATQMLNMINEYGVNKKRNGWREVFRILDENDKPLSINGIFVYRISDTLRHILIHAGNRFYRITDSSGSYSDPEDITTAGHQASGTHPADVDVNKLLNQRSQAFFSNQKCYIIGCGDFLVYGKWRNGQYGLRRVYCNEDTYIPTTTISIDNDTVTSDEARGTLDDINYLNPRRKNTMVGTEGSGTWTVDSRKIKAETMVAVKVTTLSDGEEQTKIYTNATSVADGGTLDQVIVATFNDLHPYDENAEDKIDTSVTVGSIDRNTGKITLTIDTTPPIEGQANIEVEFDPDTEDLSNNITNCNFGILFGVNGNTDRLFLSGNADHKNIDYFSEQDDYTYFSPTNTAAMGSDAYAIVGYSRLSDSTLVIYKEDNTQDACIFYRQGAQTTVYDDNGAFKEERTYFPTTAGSIGEAVVSRHASANFSGDTLILSRNGVFGVVLGSNVATNERYTRERSRLINEKLCRHNDLSEAVAIVYNNRYYLSVDGSCYVADARYKFSGSDDIDGSFNYEWWYWENIPAHVWAVIDDQLYFGTIDGRICVFDDKYSDRTYTNAEAGEVTIDTQNSTIVYNKESGDIATSIAENDIFEIETDGTYSLFLDSSDFSKVQNDRIYLNENYLEPDKYFDGLFNGIEIYADNVYGSGLTPNKTYYVVDVDQGNMSFALSTTADGKNVVPLSNASFRLLRHISHIPLYLVPVEHDGSSGYEFKVKMFADEIKTLTLSAYNDDTSDPATCKGKFTHFENVVAKWYTPIFDLGANDIAKTLYKITVSTEPEVNGKLSFGYETKNVSKLRNAKGINTFSFDDLSFDNFSFETGFASSYTVRVKERNFNYIMFRFESNNAYNCAVNNFTVTYAYSRTNRGVR